jgi:ribosome biogenesis GTPase
LRKGIITKFHSNFAVVKDEDDGLETLCTLRGRMKLSKTKPMVGDRVEYIVSHDRGRIESILPRTITLKRPRVSNVDTVVVVITRSQPNVVWSMVDRILAGVELSNVRIVLALNKIDITSKNEIDEFKSIYRHYDVVLTSTYEAKGIDELEELLRGHISVFAGPSGVGKSSLLNSILKSDLKTGAISQATNLGKHTTTSASLMELKKGGFVVDTPGFITMNFRDVEPLKVQELFPEIKAASFACLFDDCVHDAEPGCHVKELVENGEIAKSRYESYIGILHESEGEEHL